MKLAKMTALSIALAALAAVSTFAVSPSAKAAGTTQKGNLVPARVTDIKVVVAPAGSPTGVGAARAFATITALVRFCRGVAPEQFEVKVRKSTKLQTVEILDVYLTDCRSMGTIQEVVLQTAALEAYKPVVIKNTYLVDYGM
ncbi:MAG: hypothetical protein J0L82_00860 [Deltaproteobacteria bacterium]|nr:hypothetical protein [Deltaproteobacteria bacterium]